MEAIFDPAQAPPGATKLFLSSTMLHWDALGVDPNVIAENSARLDAWGKPISRFQPTEAVYDDRPVAVVAFGPSLRETWEEVESYSRIITCSGAHKFLLERGVVPDFHVESDPRIHKVDMLGEPNGLVSYLVASICHPRYFAKLANHKVLLWHLLFQDKAIYPLVPKGEWILTGGNTVGPRAIKIARLLGYTNLHMFGFDGSGKHADVHANPPPDSKYRECHFEGQTYLTTENLFNHIELLFQDLNTIPDASFTFHGDGLIQAISKKFQYRYKEGYPLAVVKDD